jgi:hypothetical protein
MPRSALAEKLVRNAEARGKPKGLRAVTAALVVAPQLLGSSLISAQSLPLLHSINPVAEARSGLYFQPLVLPGRGWRVSVGVDYASMLELNFRRTLTDTSYLLDAEVLRLNLSATRGLGSRDFMTAEAFFGGSYDGFLDNFLNWYHGLLGIRYPEREDRPRNSYAYQYRFRNNRLERFSRHGGYLGDVRIGIGHRYDDRSQSVLSLTLPTNTAGDGYVRGTVSFSLLNTLRAPITRRLVYEGSLNTGFTPRHGPLTGIQRRLFVLGTSGIRWRTFGRLWTFGNLYLHSPYYQNTDASQLDRWDLTVDFGWIIRSKGGREFRFGMAEDPWPSGPAVDANFRLGVTF